MQNYFRAMIIWSIHFNHLYSTQWSRKNAPFNILWYWYENAEVQYVVKNVLWNVWRSNR